MSPLWLVVRLLSPETVRAETKEFQLRQETIDEGPINPKYFVIPKPTSFCFSAGFVAACVGGSVDRADGDDGAIDYAIRT